MRRVVAICDRGSNRPGSGPRKPASPTQPCYDDLEQALWHTRRRHRLDLHAAARPLPARAGRRRGRQALLIEKPVGISLEELRADARAVRRAGVSTVVSFVLRWNPLFRTLKAMLADNALGRPYYVEADYLSYNGSWWSGWNDARTIAQGVSAFLVGGCHAIDALRWFAVAGRVRGRHAGRGVRRFRRLPQRGTARVQPASRTPGSTMRRPWNTTAWKWPW